MSALGKARAGIVRERVTLPCLGADNGRMFNALRYYWIISKGYRLRPWKSPYIQWRLETFFGGEAAELDAEKFFSLMWRERERLKSFLGWVAERRREQKRKS